MGPQGPLVHFLSVDLPVLDGPRERGWNSVASWVCSSCWAPGVRCQSLAPHWDQGVLCGIDGWTTFCLLLRPLMDMWDFPLLGC